MQHAAGDNAYMRIVRSSADELVLERRMSVRYQILFYGALALAVYKAIAGALVGAAMQLAVGVIFALVAASYYEPARVWRIRPGAITMDAAALLGRGRRVVYSASAVEVRVVSERQKLAGEGHVVAIVFEDGCTVGLTSACIVCRKSDADDIGRRVGALLHVPAEAVRND
eukprot:m.180209 g.180209  ORF g.180209 m.180209 type:complete len:170 (-) comp9990_c2_seq22:1533-2042(-)